MLSLHLFSTLFLLPLYLALPPVLASLSGFFNNLRDIVTSFALAASAFFFSWAAILFMTAGNNERRLDHAKMSLYTALGGLALALLANTLATLVHNAAHGQ